jgi:phage tail sheath gpL-like
MRNDQHMTILPENGSPTPHWLWAPAYCGAAAVALKADPARPVQTLAVNGVVAPPVSSRFDITSRNTLLFTGMSTFAVSDDGTVRLENLITTYQKNAFGQPDNSYLEIETMFQLMFLMRDLKGDLTSKYPRAKLASSVARLAPGVQVVTTAMIRSEIIAHYRTLEYNGQAQDSAAFAAGLIVTQNVNNHNRVDILWAGTIMNQLRLFAVLAQFRQ